MAIHWLAHVPWGEIIANAPRIVEAAKKLGTYLKKPAGPAGMPPAPEPVTGTVEQELAALKARVSELEAAQATAARVVQSLADNGENIAEAVTSLRKQAVLNFRLAVACVVGLIVVVMVLATK